jgi:hypothetical protein
MSSKKTQGKKPKPKSASKKVEKPKSKSVSKVLKVDELPALRLREAIISRYRVVASKSDEIGKHGRYGLVAWTPEDYDYETHKRHVPTLYLFEHKPDRDDMQEELYDSAPTLYLRAIAFKHPVLIQNSPPAKH